MSEDTFNPEEIEQYLKELWDKQTANPDRKTLMIALGLPGLKKFEENLKKAQLPSVRDQLRSSWDLYAQEQGFEDWQDLSNCYRRRLTPEYIEDNALEASTLFIEALLSVNPEAIERFQQLKNKDHE